MIDYLVHWVGSRWKRQLIAVWCKINKQVSELKFEAMFGVVLFNPSSKGKESLNGRILETAYKMLFSIGIIESFGGGVFQIRGLKAA